MNPNEMPQNPPPQPPKKKKKWVLPVILVLVIVLAVSCMSMGGEDKAPESTSAASGSTGTTENREEQTQAPASHPTETKAPEKITVEKTVFYDKDGVTLTATKYEEDEIFGPELKVEVSNQSKQNLIVHCEQVSVNGFMMESAELYCDVAAGKKAMDSFSFSRSALKQAGIETVMDIQFVVRLVDQGSYDTLDKSQVITVSTSASGKEPQKTDDSGETVYDKDGLRMVSQGLKKDLLWDGTVVFYMENNRSTNLHIHAENISVNGFMVTATLSSELRSGTKAVDGLMLLDLEELDIDSIDDIKDVEFTLRIVNTDDFTESEETKPITLRFH